jgi:hypothetical protein
MSAMVGFYMIIRPVYWTSSAGTDHRGLSRTTELPRMKRSQVTGDAGPRSPFVLARDGGPGSRTGGARNVHHFRALWRPAT